MRLNNLVLFSIFFFAAGLKAQKKLTYNPFIDVQHYGFSIEVSDLNNEIKGNAAISVIFLQGTQEVIFDLANKNDKAAGMVVAAVKQNGQDVTFDHSGNHLKIRLHNAARAGDTSTFDITYGGTPADGLVFSKNKFGQRTIFGDNWPNRAHNWLPCVDHLSDKASVDFIVTAPDHYQVISNGLLMEESAVSGHKKLTHWQETVSLPTKVMVIGLADFAVNYTGTIDCIPVSSWVFPEDKKNGFYDYGEAMEILPFFIKQVGPYAYKKLANVEAITIFGGMENASAIFYNERSITGTRSSEELLAHEIAHQWFGNSATESGWPHVWLSEGFATEMTNLYLESKYGADTLKARLQADRKTVIAFEKSRFTPVVDSSEKENFLTLLNQNSYQKGGWILHMLRRKLGDTLFWKGIRAYYSRYSGKNASTDDLRKVMEDVAQVDLKDFFQQWLYTAGHPQLSITWKYNENKKELKLRIIQQQQPLFSFWLEFNFINDGVKKDNHQSIPVENKMTEITLSLSSKPTKIIADPFTDLLFEASISEE